jgi:hypothetical protein
MPSTWIDEVIVCGLDIPEIPNVLSSNFRGKLTVILFKNTINASASLSDVALDSASKHDIGVALDEYLQ